MPLDLRSTRVVALGGGHGLAATLTALRQITAKITAIVTVADNGGSSGRLRSEFNILPPGDLRMALAALCSDDEWGRAWAEIIQYRFTSEGEMNGHALGNLLLAALWDREGDPVSGVDRVASLLKVVGRVLPMAVAPLDIEGTFVMGQQKIVIRGQKEVARAQGQLENLTLIPANPRPTKEGLAAIAQAEWITIGPGSWFSSVLPHFLMKEQMEAIITSPAKKVLILNLDAQLDAEGDEFAGNSPEDHVKILQKFAPNFRCDIALVDQSIVNSKSGSGKASLERAISAAGGQLIVADLSENLGSIHHSSKKMALTLSHIFSR